MQVESMSCDEMEKEAKEVGEQVTELEALISNAKMQVEKLERRRRSLFLRSYYLRNAVKNSKFFDELTLYGATLRRYECNCGASLFLRKCSCEPVARQVKVNLITDSDFSVAFGRFESDYFSTHTNLPAAATGFVIGIPDSVPEFIRNELQRFLPARVQAYRWRYGYPIDFMVDMQNTTVEKEGVVLSYYVRDL